MSLEFRKDIGNLKLSAQKALLGNVLPNLRAVCVDCEVGKIFVSFYVDGKISKENMESYNNTVDQIIADFLKDEKKNDSELSIVQLDYPEKMPLKGDWVYYRSED